MAEIEVDGLFHGLFQSSFPCLRGVLGPEKLKKTQRCKGFSRSCRPQHAQGFKREQEKIDALMDQEVDEAELEEPLGSISGPK